MAVVSVGGAKGCGSADNQSIGRCDGGCLLFPAVPLSVFFLRGVFMPYVQGMFQLLVFLVVLYTLYKITS